MNNLRIQRIVLLCITICFVAWAALFILKSSCIGIDGKRWFCLFDDAMISMRYAWNLSHGFGLVWNPGEYVEGYTNLLMTLVMSLATLVFSKSSAVLAIQIFGIAVSLVIASVVARIAGLISAEETNGHRSVLAVAGFFCTLCYYPLMYWSLTGMETGLLTLLLSCAVLSALRYVQKPRSVYLYQMGALTGLAYLTRPDSLIVAAILFTFISLACLTSSRGLKGSASILGALSIVAGFVVGVGIWRWHYYGELTPNTFTLKLVGMPVAIRIQNGLGFLTPFLKFTFPVYIVAVVGLAAKFRAQKLLLLSIGIILVAYQIYVGGDPWPYWRIMSPSLPLLFILVAHELLRFGEYASGRMRLADSNSYRRPAAIGITLTVLLLVIVNVPFRREIAFRALPYFTKPNGQNINTAIALNKLTKPDATVGVFWAGTIPYFTGRSAVDFLGKADSHIAHLPPDISGKCGWNGMTSVPGHNKYDLNYSIKKLKPTFVQKTKWCSQDLSDWGRSNYVSVQYQGVSLLLLKGSDSVHWSVIRHSAATGGSH